MSCDKKIFSNELTTQIMRTALILSTSIFLLLFHFSAQAQTLTQENSAPQIGDVFITHASLPIEPGDSGENITWDLSGLVALDTTEISYQHPSTHPQGSIYQDATVVGINGDAGEFLRVSTFAVQRLGISAPSFGFEVNYKEDPEVFLTFPFHYASIFTNEFSGTATYEGSAKIRTGAITVTADGTGTLIMPYGEFNNVLRVKVIETTTDTAQGQTLDIKTVTYAWYQEGIHASIASYVKTTADSMVSTASYFLDQSIITASLHPALLDIQLLVAPNPTSDIVQATFNLDQPARVQWQLQTIAGQKASSLIAEFRQRGAQTIDIDLSNYPTGNYLLQIAFDGQMVSKIITKQ